jgi:Ca2+/Na+ antiporter
MLPTVLLVVAALGGAALVCYGAASVVRALRVRTWREVSAVVLERQIASTQVHVRQFHTAYYPVVRFRYETPHGQNESSAFSVAKNDYRSFDRLAVERELQEYEPGRTVTAYVSPSNPSQAVLRAQVSSSSMNHYLAVLSGGVLVLVACALLARHAVP